MIVNLFRSADYPIEKFNDVLGILNKSQKRIKFKKLPDAEVLLNPTGSVSRTILFKCCNDIRRRHSIPSEDFVIFITTVKNNDNWFSRFDKQKNVFIYGPEWDNMKNLSIYPVAYEIMANVLQSLMDLSLRSNSKLLHQNPIGCMNDFCDDKSQIILKLRTGDICEACINELERKKVAPLLIDQAVEIFERIRVQLLFRQGLKRKASPIRITKTSFILVDYKELEISDVNFTALRKTLFLFFLQHEGTSSKNFDKRYFDKLSIIYKNFKGTKPTAIKRLLDQSSNSFHENRSVLNKILEKTLGKRLAEIYKINPIKGDVLSIKLDKKLVELVDFQIE